MRKVRKCYRTELEPGQRFGSWTVISKDETETKKRKYTMYICKCDCGVVESVRATRLTNGYTTNCKSCGNKKMSKTKRGKNQYDLTNEYGIGWTTNTNRMFLFDLEDYERIKEYTWYENTTTGYVTTTSYNKIMDLHRFIMKAKSGETVDHKHGNESKMDNRKSNLRIVTKGQNNINTGLRRNNKSGTTGVSWSKTMNKWRSRIGYQNKQLELGFFDNLDDAIEARIAAENKYYGEYSYGNSQKN